jgi:cytochrome P450/NADPH-cytochrome P450 reductase
LLQTFHFTKAHSSYQLQIKMSLTIKPEDFYIKAKVRDPDFLEHAGFLIGDQGKQKRAPETKKRDADVPKAVLKPIKVCSGSNTGRHWPTPLLPRHRSLGIRQR